MLRKAMLFAATVAAFVYAAPSTAMDLTGWCFPADECMGEPSPIGRDGFSTCEEFCRLSEETAVRGMNAALFDVNCGGDGSSRNYRIMILLYTHEAQARAAVITSDGISELERCP